MKYLLFLLIIFLSCERKTRELPKNVIKIPERLLVIEDLRNIRMNIERFKIELGRLPNSIDELNLKLNYPDEYIYDPRTGNVKSKNYKNL